MRFKKIQKKVNTSQIEAAIADFESRLNFEFVPVIANKSSYVEHISRIISLLLLILFIALIDFIFSSQLHDSWLSPVPFYFMSPLVSYFLGSVIDKSDTIDRFFISKKERIRQVQEHAELFFFRNQLHEVQSHNALLLYISVMERQIVLYHDRRISFDKMTSLNEELLQSLQKSFQNNDFEQGLLNCIQTLKTNLEVHPHYQRYQNSTLENFVPNKLHWLENEV